MIELTPAKWSRVMSGGNLAFPSLRPCQFSKLHLITNIVAWITEKKPAPLLKQFTHSTATVYATFADSYYPNDIRWLFH